MTKEIKDKFNYLEEQIKDYNIDRKTVQNELINAVNQLKDSLQDVIVIKNALQINIRSTKDLFEHFSNFQEMFADLKDKIKAISHVNERLKKENKELKEDNKILKEKVQTLIETCEMFSEHLAVIEVKLNKLENPPNKR